MEETNKEIKNSKPLLALSDEDSKISGDTTYCNVLSMPDIIKQNMLSVFKHYKMINFEI